MEDWPDNHDNTSHAAGSTSAEAPHRAAKSKNGPTIEDRVASLNRSLPFSDEAEKGLLSVFLQDNDSYARLSECAVQIPVEAFYHRANRTVYEMLLAFLDRGAPIDIATLTQALRERQQLDLVGGAAAISELYMFIPNGVHFGFYKKQVMDRYHLRTMIAALAEGITACYDHGSEGVDEDIRPLISRIEAAVFKVLQVVQGSSEGGTGPLAAVEFMPAYVDHLERVMANVGNVLGLKTGLPDVDLVLGGLDDRRGELLVVGARPGHGKTALLGTLLHHMCIQGGVPTLMFSLEMSTDQILDRVVFGGNDINTSKARTGMLSREEKRDLGMHIRRVQDSRLWIDDSAELTTVDLRVKVQTMHRLHGIKLVIVDYLQLVLPATKLGRSEERLAITEALQTIHVLKKLGIVFICAAQLNQNIEKTPGRRHMLSDFAGSDAIGKYADYAKFITRPAEVKRWKDLSDKQKDNQIARWKESRQAKPELWCGWISKQGSPHPLDAEADNGSPRFRDKVAEADGESADRDTTTLTVPGGTQWTFDNEKDWDESAELQFVKNRNGPTPDRPVRFRREFARFDSRVTKLFSNNDAERQH